MWVVHHLLLHVVVVGIIGLRVIGLVVRVNVWVLIVCLHLALSLSINFLPHILMSIVVYHSCTKFALLVTVIEFPQLILFIGQILIVILKSILLLMFPLNRSL